MNEIKNVIGLCSANVERSRIFESIFAYVIEQQKLYNLIQVYSAGLNVEKIMAAESPLRIQVNILKGGLAYDVVRDEIKNEVMKIVDKGTDQEHTDKIKAFYAEVRPSFVHDINVRYVNQALLEAGIDIKHISSPFKTFQPQIGFDLVLPMAEKDIAKVVDKYEKMGLIQPSIMTYGQLVGTQDLQDKNMASGLSGAREKVQYFMDTRKQALEEMCKYAA